MMTDERFAEIRLLRAQGTAGPWKAEPVGLFKTDWNVVGDDEIVAECLTHRIGASFSIAYADALAICAIDELIAEVERLRGMSSHATPQQTD